MKITVKIYLLLALLIPLSISIPWGRLQINVPAEPLIAILALFLLFQVKVRHLFCQPFIKHPVTVVFLVYFGWMFITTWTSSLPIVSAKFLLVSVAHWWVFYLGFYSVGLTSRLTIWNRWYSYGLVPVFLLIWVNFAHYDFNPSAAVILAQPFYDDHTIISAAIALLLPVIGLGLWLNKEQPKFERLGVGIGSILMVGAMLIMFSRAAWLSLGLASVLVMTLKIWKISFWRVMALCSALGGIFMVVLLSAPRPARTPEEIINKEKISNKIKSIMLWRHDVSTLERLNRYKCAWRMFLDRPWVGFGPGTYPDQYLNYQRPEDMTRLSVTSPTGPDGQPHPQGRGGSTHSEYLQHLSEMGLPGVILWLGVVLTSLFTGYRAYFKSKTPAEQWVVIALLFALISYFIHLCFNNWLHSEKVDALFLPIIAVLVSMDIQRSNSTDFNV